MPDTAQPMIVAGREVKVTNLEKIFFPKPGLTKGDLIRYYVDVAGAVLHHVARRPMQMKRHPNGVDGEFFYQKRVANINRPDYLLIDLDPSEGNPWSHVREIAMAAKRVMDDLHLPSYPKTSGVTGLHILVPIVVELEFPLVREIARAMAKEIVKLVPTIATTQWKVAGRPGVVVDYGQNTFDRTIASAYSIRPVADARASAPLRWDERPDVEPGDFTMVAMRDRIAKVGALTAGMWEKAVSLDPLFDALKVKRTLPKRSPRKGPPVDWRAQYGKGARQQRGPGP